jgi:RNA polymerase sigma-70 factor, ECF subfamily
VPVASDHAAIAGLWKREAPRVIGRLTSILKDLSLAEEFAQDALVAALTEWPRSGMPDNPGAWLMTTAKNKALNSLRRGKFYADLGEGGDIEERAPHDSLAQVEEALEDSLDRDIQDDVLRLLFAACHPVLAREAAVALTLRTVGGLSTAEIARAFLATEPTIAQRIVRAKRALGEARVDFELPRGDELGARLSSVLEVVYLVFNEGYAATAGDAIVRRDLCAEAIRLGELLVALAPGEPEAHALLAVMCLQASREPARTDASGEAILLAAQDRSLWDRGLIERGLAEADRAGTAGAYALQANIAACHARASSIETTDWSRIVELYGALETIVPSPVVALNRAVALSRAEGPEAGLAAIDALRSAPELERYHLLPSARAELLEQLGRYAEAADEFARAATIATNPRQKERLAERAAACRNPSEHPKRPDGT